MGRNPVILVLLILAVFGGCSSASASPPAKIVSGLVSNVVSVLFKWLWSLKSPKETTSSHRSMMKFEGGYNIETVFDGSKFGIEPFSVVVSPAGEILVLDSENSNIYKISMPLSRYSRPKLVAGSPEGYSGHVDGKPREARMSHPKGLTVDDRGNIYVADIMNMAIRKISDGGVATIAGGNWGRGGGHVDGPSEDAKFSNDFDVVYVGSSCSLLVIDRGNQAIREIQLHDDDCSSDHDGNLQLGIAVLVAAGFFGYMMALLQRRVLAMFAFRRDPRVCAMKVMPPATYQRPVNSARRPPLSPPEDESVKTEEGLFRSLWRLFLNTGSSLVEIFGGFFSGFRKKPHCHHMQEQQRYHQTLNHPSAWPIQESFMIPHEDQPPSLDSRDPTPRKSYPYVAKDQDNTKRLKQERCFYGERNDNYHHQQQQQQQQQHQKHHSDNPQTYYEQNCETNEIVFGAVQEQDGRRGAMVIKAVDYGNPMYNNHNVRSRYSYMGYSYGY